MPLPTNSQVPSDIPVVTLDADAGFTATRQLDHQGLACAPVGSPKITPRFMVLKAVREVFRHRVGLLVSTTTWPLNWRSGSGEASVALHHGLLQAPPCSPGRHVAAAAPLGCGVFWR